MSQPAAARAAGVSRTTWRSWESGTSEPERFNYTKIESAMRWEPGGVEAAMDGREPTPHDHSPPHDDVSEPPAGLGIDLARWRSFTETDRRALTAIYDAAEQRRSHGGSQRNAS